jgi:hypothetical protein
MEKPNFLLIITDQQRADTLGIYGSDIDATPNIDLLGSTGVTFNRGYCNNPLCMPSRASILAGRYPSATGVRTNGVVARPGQPLLPELLSKAGYQTAAFGKLHYHPSMGMGSPKVTDYWPESPDTIASGVDLTKPYLGFQTIALACGHGDVARGLHARELSEKFPEVYGKRGPNNALLVPDPLLHHAQKINTYKTSIPVEYYPTTIRIIRSNHPDITGGCSSRKTCRFPLGARENWTISLPIFATFLRASIEAWIRMVFSWAAKII